MKNAALATVVPSLEVFYLQDRKTSIIAAHNGVEVTGEGHPRVRDENEEVVARWGAFAKLGVVMNDDGFGPRGGGADCQFMLVAEGDLSLAVTNLRLIGSFVKARGAVGAMDADERRVLTFAWGFDDVHNVSLEKKVKMFGGEKFVEASVQCAAYPLAGLTVTAATALDETWTSAWVPRSDLDALARSMAEACARYRQRQGLDGDRLERILRGEWTVEGTTHIAWLVDPDANPTDAAG